MTPALDLLKSLEPSESLWFVFNDPQVVPVLIGWGLYAPAYADPGLPDGAGDFKVGQLRARCWDAIEEPNFDRLAALTGLTVPTCREKFMLCAEASLIYPDGTMSTRALLIVRKSVDALVSHLTGGQQRAQIETAPAETLPTKGKTRRRRERPAKRKFEPKAAKP